MTRAIPAVQQVILVDPGADSARFMTLVTADQNGVVETRVPLEPGEAKAVSLPDGRHVVVHRPRVEGR